MVFCECAMCMEVGWVIDLFAYFCVLFVAALQLLSSCGTFS